MTLTAATAGSSVSGLDLVNLFASAFSIVLAVVALTLAIFFFVQSKNSADQSEKSSEEISASVTRLEKLFDSLYSDTFAMMRDTVTDMRRHVWKAAPVDAKEDHAQEPTELTENELEKSQKELLEELGRVSKNIGLTDAKISELSTQLAPVIQQTLKDQEEVVRDDDRREYETATKGDVLLLLEGRPMSLRSLTQITGAKEGKLAGILFSLNRQNAVTWKNAPSALDPLELIRLVPSTTSQRPARAKNAAGNSSAVPRGEQGEGSSRQTG